MGKIKIIQKHIDTDAGYAFGDVFDIAAAGDEGVTIVTASGKSFSALRRLHRAYDRARDAGRGCARTGYLRRRHRAPFQEGMGTG